MEKTILLVLVFLLSFFLRYLFISVTCTSLCVTIPPMLLNERFVRFVMAGDSTTESFEVIV